MLDKSVSRNCVICQCIYNKNQVIGDLQASRVISAAPFSCVGIDLARPINVS